MILSRYTHNVDQVARNVLTIGLYNNYLYIIIIIMSY